MLHHVRCAEEEAVSLSAKYNTYDVGAVTGSVLAWVLACKKRKTTESTGLRLDDQHSEYSIQTGTSFCQS